MQKFHFFPVIRKLVNTSIRNLILQVEPSYLQKQANGCDGSLPTGAKPSTGCGTV